MSAVVAQLKRALKPSTPDHRLRAPLRHVQAGEPVAAGYRRARGTWSTIPRCRCSWSSPASHTRSTGPARAVLQQVARLMRDPRFIGKMALHRRLRHQRRTTSRAGSRSVGQQPAPPSRSMRDERPESRAERRAESVGAGWLVGEAYDGLQRLSRSGTGETHSNRDSRYAR